MKKILARITVGFALLGIASTVPAALIATQTTNSAALAAALGGTGLTINSVTTPNGAATQFGTYTNFNQGPVTIGPGVVLSTGLVTQTPAPASAANTPSTQIGSGGTAEFNTYGPGHITNFTSSNDVASMQVNFTLASASAISFDFIFGSIEYPQFVSNFTDAFLVFLDGVAVANQITFDANGNPVQVGASFASSLTTADQNSAFASPHGLISNLTTISSLLSAGAHTLRFEVGDVNDQQLDSAAFITNFAVCHGHLPSRDDTTGSPRARHISAALAPAWSV